MHESRFIVMAGYCLNSSVILKHHPVGIFRIERVLQTNQGYHVSERRDRHYVVRAGSENRRAVLNSHHPQVVDRVRLRSSASKMASAISRMD
jgi:hypothetical protein